MPDSKTHLATVPYATGGPDFHSHLDDKHEFHGHAAAIRVCSKCRAELALDIQRLAHRLARATDE